MATKSPSKRDSKGKKYKLRGDAIQQIEFVEYFISLHSHNGALLRVEMIF